LSRPYLWRVNQMFKSYIDPVEGAEAKKKLPKLMVEGLLLGGTGLGVLALIFEIAADAFSVAAYQTLLAIHGAEGHHEVAIAAFIVLSILLFVGIVPAYKAGAYLRPNAGGSGPLVEAIGPPKMRWLSWIGTSLFFLDAVLTIIISSISASDVTMLVLPELAPYRILLAEVFAFFIMVVLVLMGPKRAVPLFLIGGGAFTIFTIGALSVVGGTAALNSDWAFLTGGIVTRLQSEGVVSEVIRADTTMVIGGALMLKLFFASMSSAMLGFSGYEVIPASGKHAARPKWKVINTALTLAAIFLIGTGMVQLYAAKQWNIPATEGYSTLLIEYEINAVQLMSGDEPLTKDDVEVLPEDKVKAQLLLAEHSEGHATEYSDEEIDEVAFDVAVSRLIGEELLNSNGAVFLFIAGSLLAVILLLAQGGGYIGGAAVAANAARLGRLPKFFSNDRIGIAIIWGVSATLIPIIREVVVVEAYYAFGFVSAFVITSTTVFFVRNDILVERGIAPGSAEAKSLKFAGLRGMIASYFMMAVLVTQKTSALPVIVISGALITAFQLYYANGSFKKKREQKAIAPPVVSGEAPSFEIGTQRAHDQARQHGIVDALEDLLAMDRFLVKFNVGPERIKKLVCYLYNIDERLFHTGGADHHERTEEPSVDLAATYEEAYGRRAEIAMRIEEYSHYGIFMFIHNYHVNWVDEKNGRDAGIVQQAMINLLFPLTDDAIIWAEYREFIPTRQPEAVWQFSRSRYRWAKNQWPNLSDRITTIWTLQDFGLLPLDVDTGSALAVVANGPERMAIDFVEYESDDDEED